MSLDLTLSGRRDRVFVRALRHNHFVLWMGQSRRERQRLSLAESIARRHAAEVSAPGPVKYDPYVGDIMGTDADKFESTCGYCGCIGGQECCHCQDVQTIKLGQLL